MSFSYAGRALPYFTDLCIALRAGLIFSPVVVAAYYFWLWHREEKISRWMGFVVAAMTVKEGGAWLIFGIDLCRQRSITN